MAIFLKIMSFTVWVFMMVLLIKGSRRKTAGRSCRPMKASKAADADTSGLLFVARGKDNLMRVSILRCSWHPT